MGGNGIFKLSTFNKRPIQAQKLILFIFFSTDSDFSLNLLYPWIGNEYKRPSKKILIFFRFKKVGTTVHGK